MKVQFKNYLFISLIWLVAISCSSIIETRIERSPAATQNCSTLIQSFISDSEKIPVSKNIDELDLPTISSEPSLSSIINKREELQEQYTKITESIRDFELHPDLPIKGLAKLILDAQEGLLTKIMLIRNAKKTIDLSYFIFNNDDSAKALLHELRLAIKRGVKVRILIDSAGSFSKAPFYNDIKALIALSGRPILDELGRPTGEFAKAEAVLFNPLFNVRSHVENWFKLVHNLFASEDNQLPRATFAINRRSHDKILLIDANSPTDSYAMIGGRNMADDYYGINDGADHPISDAEILIKNFSQKNSDGTIKNILEDHFNKIYFYLANKNFEKFLLKINRNKVRKEFQEMRASSKRVYGAEGPLNQKLKQMVDSKFLETDFEEGLISILNEIQNLSRTKIFLAPNGPQNKVNGNSLLKEFHTALDKAQNSIDLVSPYLSITDEEIERLIKWAEVSPHRKFRAFSGSLATSNNVVAQAIVDATYKEIAKRIKGTSVENQIELYSFGRIDDKAMNGNKNYGFLHAKILMVDKKNPTISTSNLDPISRHLNSEIGAAISNLPANSKNVQKLVTYIDDLKDKSTLWGSPESDDIRKHPKNRIVSILEIFVTKIIYALNLVPIL